MQTRDQQYAAAIFSQVDAFARQNPAPEPEKPSSAQLKYGAMAHRLPVLVRTAGLTQALAFVQARGNDVQRELLEHLANTVLNGGTAQQLLDRSRTSHLGTYMHLTQQVLDALIWYKRFAQSILHVEGDNLGDGQERR